MQILRDLTICLAVVTVLCSQFVNGCRPVGDPVIEIDVIQDRERVSFKFFMLEGRIYSNRIERVPHKVGSLWIGNSKSTIWEIKNRSTSFGVTTITYGVVPEGFDQTIPKNGTAPTLKSGSEYEVLVGFGAGGTTRFIYK